VRHKSDSELKMFANFGATEIIIIIVVIALLFGAKRIPEIAKGIGKGIHDFKKEIKSTKDITK
jgi:sec-independent protein translocase protein TatA